MATKLIKTLQVELSEPEAKSIASAFGEKIGQRNFYNSLDGANTFARILSLVQTAQDSRQLFELATVVIEHRPELKRQIDDALSDKEVIAETKEIPTLYYKLVLRTWCDNNKPTNLLLTGRYLKHANELKGKNAAPFNEGKARDFLEESFRHARRGKTQRNLIYSSVVFLSLITVFFTTQVVVKPLYIRLSAVNDVKMVEIRGTTAIIGTNTGPKKESPQITPAMNNFSIAATETTKQQYQMCIDAGDCKEPNDEHIRDSRFARHPVVGVDIRQAAQFCEWLDFRLPTEVEWERAARGTNGASWPWSWQNPALSWNKDLANMDGGDTQPIAQNSERATPEGVYDLVGNVWEWTATYGTDTYQNYTPAIWHGTREQLSNDPNHVGFVIRGGGWQLKIPRVTFRDERFPNANQRDLGFRCVKDIS